MKTRGHRKLLASAFMMTEALVYIGVVFVLLGVGYVAMYRCIDSSLVLRRNANDITSALQTGERWRTDVRAATQEARSEGTSIEPVFHLTSPRGTVEYRLENGTVYRRSGEGPWVKAIERVRSSRMLRDPRSEVIAWRWELELEPQSKGSVKPGSFRPLFTFLAVPRPSSAP